MMWWVSGYGLRLERGELGTVSTRFFFIWQKKKANSTCPILLSLIEGQKEKHSHTYP